MRDKLFLVAVLLIISFDILATDSLKVNSKVENMINFTNVSSQVDKKSIQVKSGSGLSIQSVNFNVNYLDSLSKSEEINMLQKRDDSLSSTKLIYENTLYVLKHEKSLLKINQVLGGEKRIITSDELEKASAYYRKRLSEISLLRIKTKTQISKIEIEKRNIINQLKELNFKKEKPVGEIWVVVLAEETGETDFSIEYFISDAGWKPKYDIWAESVNKPTVLTYKADVFQNTDDDWINVELVLSSANPSLGGTKPELKSWTLNLNENYEYSSDFQDNSDYQNSVKYYKGLKNNYSDPIKVDREMTIRGKVIDQNGEPVPGANIRVKGFSDVGTITDLDGSYSLIVPKGSSQLVVAFVGMKSEELPITGTTVNCILNNEDMCLDEVVVTALGVTREKKALGYSVSTLVPDGHGGFVNSLSGRVAGVQIRGASGISGNSPKIYFRKKKLVN